MNIMEQLLASSPKNYFNIQTGSEIEGKVLNITSNEVILELGLKAEGVIPLRELSEDLKANLKPGDSVKAIVLEAESENGQVILTMHKPAQPRAQRGTPDIDPKKIEQISKIQQEGGMIKGKVTKITQFGAFVLLDEGVEGLIHISKFGPDEKYEAGQEVNVMIDNIEKDKNRISLSTVITSTKGLIYK